MTWDPTKDDRFPIVGEMCMGQNFTTVRFDATTFKKSPKTCV